MNSLVVDDSLTMRKLIVEALHHVGIKQADEASDGMEALERCKHRRYDLILMDWNMPNMSGIDALKEIRKLGSKAAIVMVTTEAEKSRVVEALQDGADSYLIKPFQIPVFVERVEAVLKKIPPVRPSKDTPVAMEPQQDQERKMVEAKYLDPVIEALDGVFDTLLGSSIEVQNVGLADSGTRPDHVLALIAFSGEVKGTIGLSFPPETACRVVNRMLGSENAQINEELFDALAELANIIGGKCKAKISKIVGSTLELSLPTVIHGTYTVYTPARTLWTELVVGSEFGSFYTKITTDAVGILA